MKNWKIISGILFLAFLVIVRILIENTKYVGISNIIFPIIIALIIPWLLFEYQFKRQKESEQIKEKLKVHNKLYEILNRACNRNLSGKESFDFISSEIKEIRKIFENSKHLLSPDICNLWDNIANEEENKQLLLSVDFSEKESDLISLNMNKKLLDLVKNNLSKIQLKI